LVSIAALASFDETCSPRIVLDSEFHVSMRDAEGMESTVVLRCGDTLVVLRGTEHKPSSPGGSI
jgi:hypothetical protein